MTLNDTPAYSAARTFVVKLHRDACPGHGELVGRLEQLTGGDARFFRTGDELLAAIAGLVEANGGRT
jgi:hypothetical protein